MTNIAGMKKGALLSHISSEEELLDILADIIASDILEKAEHSIKEETECLKS